ncbi:MAG TPA: MaoC family dehydratase N-terminal domain-containing protein [Chloroflexota bacterium]|nr:MaoC family dehydratase N-terminal domain-containing protein [Chloroflexota bacterium]
MAVSDDPLAETRAWLGKEHPFEGADAVTLSDIRRKLEVYCFDCPLHYDEAVAQAHGYRTVVAPVVITPLWAQQPYWSPGEPSPFAPGLREKNGTGRTDIPNPYPKGLNASSEREFYEPLYPGDRLHGSWKLTDIVEKETGLGRGAFMTTETSIYKSTGELAAIHRTTGFRYYPKADRLEHAKEAPRILATESAEAPPENPPVDWSQQLRFEDVEVGQDVPPYYLWLNYQRIVMSVAADRMFSSIHHNRDQARSGGLDDIIFNTLGYEMVFEITLRRWIGLDGRITKIGPFRMVKNSHPGDTLTCRCQVTETVAEQRLAKLDIRVENPRGEAARGEALVTLPGR